MSPKPLPPARVRVARFKAHLSQYLRWVQRGHELTVYDRDTPIARVIPVSGASDGLRVRPAMRTLRGTAPPAVPKGWARTDSLAALEAERRDR